MTDLRPALLLVARFDGVGFSRLTAAQFAKPFDPVFADAMAAAGRSILDHLNADLVFVGSDEITAFMHPKLAPYAGRSEKIVSVGASYATSAFMIAAGVAEPIAFDGRMSEMSPVDAGGELLERRSSVKRNAVSDALYWHGIHAGESARSITRRLNGMPLTERFARVHELSIEIEDRQAFGVLLRRDSVAVPADWDGSKSAADDLAEWVFRVPGVDCAPTSTV